MSIKNYIQKHALKLFPTQELWFRDEDQTFWSYYLENDRLVSTIGRVENDVLKYTISVYNRVDFENFIFQKEREGYKCFAILI